MLFFDFGVFAFRGETETLWSWMPNDNEHEKREFDIQNFPQNNSNKVEFIFLSKTEPKIIILPFFLVAEEKNKTKNQRIK